MSGVDLLGPSACASSARGHCQPHVGFRRARNNAVSISVKSLEVHVKCSLLSMKVDATYPSIGFVTSSKNLVPLHVQSFESYSQRRVACL
jgi:hypothetical protein